MATSSARPERVREALLQWVADKDVGAVAFTEDTNPVQDPDASYRLAYEATFEPPSLAQARVEIWVTVEGEIATGIERCARVAERLGVGSGLYIHNPQAFVAGHEPLPVSDAGLLALLDLIADGRFALSVTVAPLVGMLSVVGVLPDGALGTLVSAGYSPKGGFREMRSVPSRPWRRLLTYDRW